MRCMLRIRRRPVRDARQNSGPPNARPQRQAPPESRPPHRRPRLWAPALRTMARYLGLLSRRRRIRRLRGAVPPLRRLRRSTALACTEGRRRPPLVSGPRGICSEAHRKAVSRHHDRDLRPELRPANRTSQVVVTGIRTSEVDRVLALKDACDHGSSHGAQLYPAGPAGPSPELEGSTARASYIDLEWTS